MQFTAATGKLAVEFGVYGIWLLKHAKRLPKDELCVLELMANYQVYLELSTNITKGLLMESIDNVIEKLKWEPLKSTYDEARLDYLALPEDKE